MCYTAAINGDLSGCGQEKCIAASYQQCFKVGVVKIVYCYGYTLLHPLHPQSYKVLWNVILADVFHSSI
jgi:hypothetical protein